MSDRSEFEKRSAVGSHGGTGRKECVSRLDAPDPTAKHPLAMETRKAAGRRPAVSGRRNSRIRRLDSRSSALR
jgi:hypothetical protein